MNKLTISLCTLCLSALSFAQSNEAGTDMEVIKKSMINKNTMPELLQNKNAELVKSLLKRYNNATQMLDVTGTERFFTADSKIYESGGSEGNYAHYIEHHLTPGSKEFKSFIYSDYKTDVQVDSNYAYAIETYNYTIIATEEKMEVKRKGVATSALKK